MSNAYFYGYYFYFASNFENLKNKIRLRFTTR